MSLTLHYEERKDKGMSKEKKKNPYFYGDEVKTNPTDQVIGIALIALALLMALAAFTLSKEFERTAEAEKYRLDNYMVYRTFDEEYKAYADSKLEQYFKYGYSREEACETVITETINKMYEDSKAFAEKHLVDKNLNGVYDTVESGEITQEEVDALYKKYFGNGFVEDNEVKTLNEIINEQ